MAAGKNALCTILERHGFFSLDFDTVVHTAINDSQSDILTAFKDIAQKQGVSLLQANGTIDRKSLAKILFSNPALLQQQEAIVYPHVIRAANTFVASHEHVAQSAKAGVIFNATVLHKIPQLLKMCNKVIFVDAKEATRLKRVIQRDALSPAEAQSRFAAQSDLLSKYQEACATLHIPIAIIQNDGDLSSLEARTFTFLA